MTPPQRIWQVEWTDDQGTHERRYRSAHRAAMQVASVLGAPSDVATLRGVWRSEGADDDRIRWLVLDPYHLLAEDRATFAPPDDPTDWQGAVDAMTWFEQVSALWTEHALRVETREPARECAGCGLPIDEYAPDLTLCAACAEEHDPT